MKGFVHQNGPAEGRAGQLKDRVEGQQAEQETVQAPVQLHLGGKGGADAGREYIIRTLDYFEGPAGKIRPAVQKNAQPLRQGGNGDQGIGNIKKALVLPGETGILPHEDAQNTERQPGEDHDDGVVLEQSETSPFRGRYCPVG